MVNLLVCKIMILQLPCNSIQFSRKYYCFWLIIISLQYCRKAVPTGMLSGAMGQFLASPTDLVKTRLQMEGRRLLDGYKPRFKHSLIKHYIIILSSLYIIIYCRYKGTWNAFYSILKSEGITGLWRGWYPNCQRAAVACLGGKK